MKTGIKKYIVIAIAVCIGCTVVLLGSCNKLTDPPQSAEKALTWFAFEQKINDWLTEDIVGTIDHTAKTVTVTVPEAAYQHKHGAPDKKFKPSFTVSPKAKLYYGTRMIKSGITEDLFIADRDYKVVAEDGSSTEYRLQIKIAYDSLLITPADAAEDVKRLYGTYRGKLHFDNNDYKMVVVCDGEKFISYSTPMSAIYTNMHWEKITETKWKCSTYHKDDFERKENSNIASFEITGDKITCKMRVIPMVDKFGKTAETKVPLEKGEGYIFSPGDGNGFKVPKAY